MATYNQMRATTQRDPMGQKFAKILGGEIKTRLPQLGADLMGLPNQTNFGSMYGQFGGIGGVDMANFPEIPQGPVWSDQQISEKWNSLADQGRQSAMSNVLSGQANQTGRGFGSVGNPAAAELERRAMTAYNAAMPGQEAGFRFDSAAGNAQHQLAAGRAGTDRGKAIESSKLGWEDLRTRMMQDWMRNMFQGAQIKGDLYNTLAGGALAMQQQQPMTQFRSDTLKKHGPTNTFLEGTLSEPMLQEQFLRGQTDLLGQKFRQLMLQNAGMENQMYGESPFVTL